MATDDRERQFERALARHLPGASPDPQCPDAEMLAAYHERSLPLEQMAVLKEHIAACERCQETLALVEQSEDVPLQTFQVADDSVVGVQVALPAVRSEFKEEHSPAERAVPGKTTPFRGVRGRPPWRWLLPVGALAAGAIAWVGVRDFQMHHRKDEQAVQTARNFQSAPPVTPSLIAPAGPPPDQLQAKRPTAPTPSGHALGNNSFSIDSENAAARNRVPSPLEAPPQAAGGDAASPAPPSPKALDMPLNGRNPSQPAVPSDSIPQRSADGGKSRDTQGAAISKGSGQGAGNVIAPAPEQDKKEKKRDANVATGAATGVVGGLPAAAKPAAKTQPAKPTNEKGRVSGRVTDPSGAVVPGTNVQLFDQNGTLVATTSTDASGNYSVSLPTGQYRLELQQSGFKTGVIDQLNVSPGENRFNGELQVGSIAETVEVTAQAATVESLNIQGRNFSALTLLNAAASDHRYILAPDEKYAWRVGEAGKIERSTDRGKTWKPEKSGVATDLTAGSATSDKVCWVVGKNGTVLLSTNGGKHWKHLASPIAGDLGGIHATDAQHATIWDLPNRATFQTSDGGVTWTTVAKP